MQDERIIELYFERDESAIENTRLKYASFCLNIACGILSIYQDAEECVNDTWLKAWNAIPPEKPHSLRAWLGRVTRNLSIDRWHKNRAKKRYSGTELLLDELSECIPASADVVKETELNELARLIDNWLDSLDKTDRVLFVRRYWYAIPLKELAAESGINEKTLAGKMFRLRNSLKKMLEKEGVSL